jgi:RNA polymerase sigma-70 factor, ECF subfamily
MDRPPQRGPYWRPRGTRLPAEKSCNKPPPGRVVLSSKGDTEVPTPTQESARRLDFTEFMRAHQDMVYTTSLRLCADAAQAEDVAQEVFLRAHKQFDQLAGNPRAAGWLKTVARNLTLTHLTRYRKRWVFFSQLGSDEGEDEGFEVTVADTEGAPVPQQVADGERRRLVEAALARLPEHQRVPLVLFHFEDLPYEEIAAQLRISLPKLKTDMHRARAALTGHLARVGIRADELQEERP